MTDASHPDLLRKCREAELSRLRELTYAMVELAASLRVEPDELVQCAEVAALRLRERRAG